MIKSSLILLLVIPGILSIYAQKPQLRDEVVLNGMWSFSPEGQNETIIPVPEYWDALPGFTTTNRAFYERSVSVPAEWNGKIVRLEFMGVNQLCEVYVNNTSVGTHIGGWTPFSFDITDLISAGKVFKLKVDVRNGSYYPFADMEGKALWPAGGAGDSDINRRAGICYDVYLRAYGQVHVLDAYIKTSFREKKIIVQYEVCNSTDWPAVVTLKGEISPQNTVTVEKSFESTPVTLDAGETKKIYLDSPWPTPRLWSPADPFLYVLHTRVMSGGTAIDLEHRRFGFREVWIAGTDLMFNGHKVQLCGESIIE